jgi:AraC-like DNA-binding protein
MQFMQKNWQFFEYSSLVKSWARIYFSNDIYRPMRFAKSNQNQAAGFNRASLPRKKIRATAGRRRFHKAFDFLKKHCCEPIGTADLSKASNLSRRGLYKAFERHASQSPGRELRRLRIDHAKYLLTHFDHELAIIARMCGYRSQNSFWVSFRNAVGESPGHFRDRFRPHSSRNKIIARHPLVPDNVIGVFLFSTGGNRRTRKTLPLSRKKFWLTRKS